MKLTNQEVTMISSALRDQAFSFEDRAKMCLMVHMKGDADRLNIEAEELRELASKISKAQEADEHGVPA